MIMSEPRIWIEAHRGDSANAPENTLAAFRRAVKLGVRSTELDVHPTLHGTLVVLHDDTVDRTTNGSGPVSDMTVEELQRLDAGSWFGRRFRGERIPILEEALEWSRGRCGLNLELKEADRSAEAIHGMARRVLAHAALDRVLFSSFRPSDLLRIRSVLPRARLAWLVSRTSRGLQPLARRAGLFALHPKDPLVTPRLVGRCHRMGLAVHVWVVNRPDRIARLEALGVQGVMTDDPRIFSL